MEGPDEPNLLPATIGEEAVARLSHIAPDGTARMVDVSTKEATLRVARAVGHVSLSEATRRLVREQALPKGDVLTVARIAGILAAKRTGELIPLCHPLPLTDIAIDLRPDDEGIAIEATARCIGPTGVEMEALTAVSVAALTIHDMCKAVDRAIRIDGIRVVEKAGGRSGHWRSEP
ncbi:MAG: cyclic pyranopterin monophosphate synthase MoaC [Armatimonadota bacterium]